MEKVLVIGPGGAGKSTFSTELGRMLNLPVIHLDTLYWHPGWIETPREEWIKIVEREASRPRWIMDGNFGGTMEIRIAACDTVIFLKLPRWLCLCRVLNRRFKYRRLSRPDMTPGCPEKLDLEFLKWVWTYPTAKAPKIMKVLEELKAKKTVLVLKSPQEVKRFLEKLRLVAEPLVA